MPSYVLNEAPIWRDALLKEEPHNFHPKSITYPIAGGGGAERKHLTGPDALLLLTPVKQA